MILKWLHISFNSLWRGLQWYFRRNQCNEPTLFSILLLGHPFTINELKYTSSCWTFSNAVLLVRLFDYSIVVMILLVRVGVSRSRSESKFPRRLRTAYALSHSVTRISPAKLTTVRFEFTKRFFFSVRTYTNYNAGLTVVRRDIKKVNQIRIYTPHANKNMYELWKHNNDNINTSHPCVT